MIDRLHSTASRSCRYFALPLLIAALAGLSLAWTPAARAERIKDMANVQGVRTNQLIGYGLVVGLDGTGDQTTQTPFTVQSIVAMLSQLGTNLPPNTNLQLKNVAAVMITAQLPAFAAPGQTVDVTVSSLGNAKSLRGGTLLLTPLKGADGQVYALAQGNVAIAGAGASAGGSKTQVNQLNAGRIPNGATVEKPVATSLGQGDYIHLELRDTDFGTARQMVAAINQTFGAPVATAVDGRTVRVQAPTAADARIAFLAQLEEVTVDPPPASAKVIFNARTGSIVMNQAVVIEACAIAHGNLTVTISSDPVISQPAPLSQGQTVVTERAQIDIKQEGNGFKAIQAGAKLADVVRTLNTLGASPADLLAILQAMKSAGALKAELEVI
ncbi:MAG TPA: flagellar basal body P-ring protein FlgI [Burkholderiales bacterium]|nr:flagellar basal body P-ring protein FlgI [Burkholderiales bacterium]